MASLENIFIAGSEKFDGKFNSGIMFTLTKKSPINYIYEMDTNNWQIEFLKDSVDVVARTTHKLSLEEVQSMGF